MKCQICGIHEADVNVFPFRRPNGDHLCGLCIGWARGADGTHQGQAVRWDMSKLDHKERETMADCY